MAVDNPLGNSVPFYINGSDESDNLPTSVTNVGPKSGIRFSAMFNNPLNLFISGQAPIVHSDDVTLTIRGSSSGYKYEFNTLDLFIEGRPFFNKLNLFIKGTDVLRSNTGSLNLFIGGHGTTVNKSLNLVVWGSNANYSLSLNRLTLDQLQLLTINELYTLPIDSTGIFSGYYTSRSLDLYIRGEGLFDGFFVYNSSMNLFLQGGVGSTAELDLFISGIPYIGQELDLYTSGVTGYIFNSIPLYIPTKDTWTRTLNLFIRGYTISGPPQFPMIFLGNDEFSDLDEFEFVTLA